MLRGMLSNTTQCQIESRKRINEVGLRRDKTYIGSHRVAAFVLGSPTAELYGVIRMNNANSESWYTRFYHEPRNQLRDVGGDGSLCWNLGPAGRIACVVEHMLLLPRQLSQCMAYKHCEEGKHLPHLRGGRGGCG